MFCDQAATRGPKIKLLQRQGNDTHRETLLNGMANSGDPACHWCSCPHREEHGFCSSWEEDKEKKGDSAP